MKRSSTVRTLAGITALVGFVGCAKIAGLDGTYSDLVSDYCKCDGSDDWFVAQCEAHVGTALDRAKAEVRHEWLASYASLSCNNCQNALACADLAPVCLPHGATCDISDSCCGFSTRSAGCVDGSCQACGKEGDTCQQTSDCCSDPELYCAPPDSPKNASTCVRRAPNCLPGEISPCNTAADCCGFEIGKANCITPDGTTTKICRQSCTFNDADNCQGCCATIQNTGPGGAIQGICVDQGLPDDTGVIQPNETVCKQLCNFTGGAQCPSSLACKCEPLTTDSQFCLDVCTTPIIPN